MVCPVFSGREQRLQSSFSLCQDPPPQLRDLSHSTEQSLSDDEQIKVHEFLFIGAVAAATVRGSQPGISARQLSDPACGSLKIFHNENF